MAGWFMLALVAVEAIGIAWAFVWPVKPSPIIRRMRERVSAMRLLSAEESTKPKVFPWWLHGGKTEVEVMFGLKAGEENALADEWERDNPGMKARRSWQRSVNDD